MGPNPYISMSLRLLSLLSDIERAFNADEPAPEGGIWETQRTVNYHQGLARLNLSVRASDETLVPMGSVLLQSFKLADGSFCLKAHLTWLRSGADYVHAIYAKPTIEWASESRRIACAWLNGRNRRAVETPHLEERLAATG